MTRSLENRIRYIHLCKANNIAMDSVHTISQVFETSRGNMENECIQAKVLSGSYTLKLKEGGKSVVWTTFREIIDENGIKIQNYVACGECKKIYHFSSHKSGTSNLLKHKCIGTEGKSIRKSMLPKKSLKPVTKEMKDLVAKSVVNFILKDIRSYETITGQGILELAQCLINIGAQHGMVDASLLLPHPITLFCNISYMANLNRKNLIPELKNILGSIGGAIILDFWSNDLHKINYLGLSVRYLKDFNMINRVLCTVELDNKITRSEEIRFAIQQALNKFDLQFLYDELVYVTDRNISDFESRCLICSVSMLNTVLDHTIKPDNLGENAEVWDIITVCMTLSSYVKGSGNQLKLNENSKTIWNNKIQMISLIYEQWDQIVEILSEQEEMNHLEHINRDILHMLVKFLTPFQQAFDELKMFSNPTLHLVLVWYYRLILQLKPNYSDSATLSLLKETAMLYLEEKMLIDILHKVAVFLHPKLKSLKILKNDVERQEVYSEVRKMIAHKRSSELSQIKLDNLEHNLNTLISNEPPLKKIKSEPIQVYHSENSHNIEFSEEAIENNDNNSIDFTDLYTCNNSFEKLPSKEKRIRETLSDFEDSCSDDEPEIDEVGKYIAFKVGKSEDFDLINWWKSHESEFPYLCKIAQFIFSIPASIGIEEKNTSLSESLFKERRSTLNPNTVDDILFLYSNLDK